MTQRTQSRYYLLDEATAERIVGLGMQFSEALREVLDQRSIDLPDENNVGLQELGFLELQANTVANAKSGINLDEIF